MKKKNLRGFNIFGIVDTRYKDNGSIGLLRGKSKTIKVALQKCRTILTSLQKVDTIPINHTDLLVVTLIGHVPNHTLINNYHVQN